MKVYTEKSSKKGFSAVEVILAAALFMIIATGAVIVVVQGLDSNRLGEEQTVATQYASEGIEATRSIQNQNFASLVNSAGTGISRVGNVWAFSESNNILSSKYTRVLTVSDVQRDGSGNIVTNGGILDPLTKKVTSTVTWNFTPTRNSSVALSTYLTNWKSLISFNTCSDYSIAQGYLSGICRQNTNQCSHNGENYLSGGDSYCVGNGSNDTCCALPGLSGTPTLTPTLTPTPSTMPTATPTPVTCGNYCSTHRYTTGTCRQNSNQCNHNGEIYESGGNNSCIGNGSNDTCCCHP